MNTLERAPVIIGTGQINDRSEDLTKAMSASDLMLEALAKANADAGGRALARFDTLEMVRLFSAPMNGIVEKLASAFPGLANAPEFVVGHGNTPMLILNRAALRIARGEAEICAVTGAEAYRTEKRQATVAAGDRPDMMKKNLRATTADTNLKYGAITPIEIYPFFENAMRAKWGQTLNDAQAESAQIWSDFSKVAAANPNAWIQRAYSPEEILTIGYGNRKLNFPYSTLMVANNSVNQGAALILASYGKAKALGISDDKLVFVGAGAAADESFDFRHRENFYASPSLQATIAEVLSRNGMQAGQFDHVELYSCFPCVPKHARREAEFRSDIPLTVSGGLTFAGGPIRNYMMHAAAAMTDKLRESGRLGMLFGNGGYLTEAHAIVLSRDPLPTAPLAEDFGVQEQADRLRGEVPPFIDDYLGSAVIETYTVTHSREGEPLFGTIIGRGEGNVRFICRAEPDEDTMDFLMSGDVEAVGASGTVVTGADGFRIWKRR